MHYRSRYLACLLLLCPVFTYHSPPYLTLPYPTMPKFLNFHADSVISSTLNKSYVGVPAQYSALLLPPPPPPLPSFDFQTIYLTEQKRSETAFTINSKKATEKPLCLNEKKPNIACIICLRLSPPPPCAAVATAVEEILLPTVRVPKILKTVLYRYNGSN